MILNRINIKTEKRAEFTDITTTIKKIIVSENFTDGLCSVFVPHTTAGITINESADPDVVKDILGHLDKKVPHNNDYLHIEGNSAAHIKTLITGSSVTIPVKDGKLVLGTWQGIFFCEYDGPRSRSYFISLV
ncbi:MAG: secondary thiamine-phosphate synthase enzyme YjbQ [Spirochaetaceae bacterium]|nr:secondary thiamine-phosphate synthase enzyme YjbQ [Spirochaetaceae bacterium]